MPIKRGGANCHSGNRGKKKHPTVFKPDDRSITDLEQENLEKEAEEKARLEKEAKEKARLEKEAKEKEKLKKEAKEKEAKERERLKKEAEEKERREEERREDEQRKLRIEQERREMELRSGTTLLTNAKFRLSPQIIYNAMVALIPNLRHVPSDIFMNQIGTPVSIGETVRRALASSGSHLLASEECMTLNELLAVFQKDGVYVKGVSEWAKVDERGIKSYKGEPELGKESVFIYRPGL